MKFIRGALFVRVVYAARVHELQLEKTSALYT
jgi:hypothetical protein